MGAAITHAAVEIDDGNIFGCAAAAAADAETELLKGGAARVEVAGMRASFQPLMLKWITVERNILFTAIQSPINDRCQFDGYKANF